MRLRAATPLQSLDIVKPKSLELPHRSRNNQSQVVFSTWLDGLSVPCENCKAKSISRGMIISNSTHVTELETGLAPSITQTEGVRSSQQDEGAEVLARAWYSERGKNAITVRKNGPCVTCAVNCAIMLRLTVVLWIGLAGRLNDDDHVRQQRSARVNTEKRGSHSAFGEHKHLPFARKVQTHGTIHDDIFAERGTLWTANPASEADPSRDVSFQVSLGSSWYNNDMSTS